MFYKTAGMRKRLVIIIFVGFFSQWAGNGIISYYLYVPQLSARFATFNANRDAATWHQCTNPSIRRSHVLHSNFGPLRWSGDLERVLGHWWCLPGQPSRHLQPERD